MSKPRPKFCVGEEVDIDSIMNPGTVYRREEITGIYWEELYLDKVFGAYRGWRYYSASFPEGCGVAHLEPQLRKLPPEERIQWSDCAFQPTNNEVTA